MGMGASVTVGVSVVTVRSFLRLAPLLIRIAKLPDYET